MENHQLQNPAAPIHNFLTTLRDCTVQAACGRHYVRVTKLRQWMKSQVGSDRHTTQASRLLDFAYRNRESPGLPVLVEQVSHGEESCLIVFSILLELGFGGLVHHFSRLEIVDKHLPIDLLTLHARLGEMELDSVDRRKLEADFERNQWRFCAAKFELGAGRQYFKNRIIPICRKKTINDKGGTAKLWEIEVQEEFVGKTLRDVVWKSRYDDPKDNFGLVSRASPRESSSHGLTSILVT